MVGAIGLGFGFLMRHLVQRKIDLIERVSQSSHTAILTISKLMNM
jgi:hypothetical protein